MTILLVSPLHLFFLYLPFYGWSRFYGMQTVACVSSSVNPGELTLDYIDSGDVFLSSEQIREPLENLIKAFN